MKRLLDKIRFGWDLWRALRTPLQAPAKPAAPRPPTPRRLEGHLFIANCQYEPLDCPWACVSMMDLGAGPLAFCATCQRTCSVRIHHSGNVEA